MSMMGCRRRSSYSITVLHSVFVSFSDKSHYVPELLNLIIFWVNQELIDRSTRFTGVATAADLIERRQRSEFQCRSPHTVLFP
jgi:hypothetical protein